MIFEGVDYLLSEGINILVPGKRKSLLIDKKQRELAGFGVFFWTVYFPIIITFVCTKTK